MITGCLTPRRCLHPLTLSLAGPDPEADLEVHLVNAELTLDAPDKNELEKILLKQRQFYSTLGCRLALAMMNKLCIFSDAAAKSETIRRQLGGIFDLTFLDIDNIHATESQPRVLFDIDLRDGPHLLELKKWLNCKSKDCKVVFITDKASHVQAIQARAIGATDIVHRPFDAGTLVQKFLGDF